MKKLLLLLLLSFGFIGPTYANIISDLFFPKLEKFNNCIDNLRKQNIDSKYKLCVDKYAKKINLSFASSSEFHPLVFTFTIDNSSSKYTIKAIHLKGYYGCKEESKCKTQYFDVTRYVPISPGEKEKIYFNDVIDLPSGIRFSDMVFRITTKEYLGFRIDY